MNEIDELNEILKKTPKQNQTETKTSEENNVMTTFKKLLKEFKSEFKIDFENGIVSFNVVMPKIEIVKVKSKEDKNVETLDIVAHIFSHQVFKRSFCIDSEYKNIEINKKIYEVPDFFNKKMLRQNDLKTWEMLFYYIFSDETNKILKEYKTTLESQSKELKDKKGR